MAAGGFGGDMRTFIAQFEIDGSGEVMLVQAHDAKSAELAIQRAVPALPLTAEIEISEAFPNGATVVRIENVELEGGLLEFERVR